MAAISSLVAVLSYAIALCGVAPLIPWLTTAPRLVLAAGLVAGVWRDFRGARPPSNWLLNMSIVPVFLYYATRFSRSNPVEPVVSMLAIMLAVRLIGEKSGRHHLQIHALSLFCLASSSLFDLSPLFLVYLTLMLFLVAVALVLLTFHDQDSRMQLPRKDLVRVLAAGVLMPLVSVPLLIFFFPVLPRTPVPLWNVMGVSTSRPSGFADKVEPGISSSAAEMSILAFRAELPRQPQPQLYWRGIVFNRLDGTRWVRDGAVPPERIVFGSPRIAQVIYPVPGLTRFLIALDAPAAIIAAPRIRPYPDATFELPSLGSKRMTYRAESAASGVLRTVPGINRDFYLRLPQEIPTRISRLAADIRSRGDSDGRRLELLEQYFRNGGYRYSLQGLPTGGHALEQFLFDTRQGNCEFFASAFALIARSAGIPARLVGGYLGGDYNDVGGYYLVMESMAHVWVEVFVDGKGWLRIDPSGFAQNAGAVLNRPRQHNTLQRLRMVLDALDHAWNRSVIAYDFDAQAGAARAAGKHLQSLEGGRLLRGVIRPTLVLALLAAIVFLVLNRNTLLPAPEERLLRRFYRQLERDCGIRLQRGRQGLFEIAGLTGNAAAHEFVSIYAGAVYRDRKLTAQEVKRLRQLLSDGFGTHG